MLSFLVTCLYAFRIVSKVFNRSIEFLEILFFSVLIAGFGTWLFTISEFRYGSLYHFFNALFFVSLLATKITKPTMYVNYGAMVLFFGGVLFQIDRNLREFPLLTHHFVSPAKNPEVQFARVKKINETYYRPLHYIEPITNKEVFYFNMSKELYDQPGCWNTPFPCVMNPK